MSITTLSARPDASGALRLFARPALGFAGSTLVTTAFMVLLSML